MTYQSIAIDSGLKNLPKLPGWVTSGRAETPETVVFRSGAALTVLEQLVSDQRHGVPVKLLANKLALTAATATSILEGRLAKVADIRDAYHLTPPGEARGPDGDLLAFWRDAVRLRLTGRDWQAGLKGLVGPGLEMDVDGWLQSAANQSQSHGPLTGCVAVMRAVLQVDDRAERVAGLLSDIVLARALNWPSVLPISAQYLTKAMLRDLRGDGQGTELPVQQRLLQSIGETIRLARNLAQCGAALRSVAPKLRAKGSDAAVTLFLSEDAVAPSSLLAPRIRGTSISMTDRAARRFCDRLVELGVARELTGRSTFRLYGIAP
ncbi:DUF1403 family protein [Roseobacter sp.]|uniref:DUF1403 family protein n=1 Tax=Roseobacter sp. TaxID=1907202 RepID=UPI0029664BAB|nr:DUF1403 family protein [Roseobacter sp.]MDW3182773.1 DUF1403 family protein [Roseobacter sp.]